MADVAGVAGHQAAPPSRPLRTPAPPAPAPRSEAGLCQLAALPLRSLILSACCQLTDDCLRTIAEGMPRLQCLGLFESGEHCTHAAGCLPAARPPCVSAACACPPPHLGVWRWGMAHPRPALALNCCAGEAVTDEGLAHLSKLRGSLTALDLGYSCWSHTPEGLAALLQQMSGLRMLNIGGCPALLEAGCWKGAAGPGIHTQPPVPSALQHPAALHCAPLCLPTRGTGGCEGTTDGVVAAVAMHCCALRELDVSESQRMTAAGVRSLGALPALQELSLGWNIRLKDEALEGLPPSLSKLDLSFCGELTDRALAAAARLPALTHLTLRKCNRVTDAVRGRGPRVRGLGAHTALQQRAPRLAPPAHCAVPRRCAGPAPAGGLRLAAAPGPVLLPDQRLRAGRAAPAARPLLPRPRRLHARRVPALHGAAHPAARAVRPRRVRQQAPRRRIRPGVCV